MQGLIGYDGKERATSLMQRRILGGTFLVLTAGRDLGGRLCGRRAAKWTERMRAQGVRSAVFAKDLPQPALFTGIREVDTLPLRRRLGAAAVSGELDALGIDERKAVVAVAGESVDGYVRDAVHTLAQRYRYILLSFSVGGEALAREMRRDCGAAVVINPAKEQLERSDALVLFGPRPGLSGENPVLCVLYEGNPYPRGDVAVGLGREFAEMTEGNWPEDQLAAALCAMGRLTPELVSCKIT